MKTRLSKTEFYTVYGISLTWDILQHRGLHTHPDAIAIASTLNTIANKYLEITKFAVLAELRYFKRGGNRYDVNDINPYNVELLKNLKISNWKLHRKKLTLKQAIFLLSNGDWSTEYGGPAWTVIAKEALNLEKILPANIGNVLKVISLLDRLNDLEHNNALYLQNYCSFCLESALGHKAAATPEQTIYKSNQEIRDIYNTHVNGQYELYS